MISKELLSEILRFDVIKIEVKKTNNKVFAYYLDGIEEMEKEVWNIYELAHKCKEWAYNNKYRLISGQHRLTTIQDYYISNQISSFYCNVYYIINDDSNIQIDADADTEPEAIFKACEWILNERD